MNHTTQILGHPKLACITGNRQLILRFFMQELEERIQTLQGYAWLIMPNADAVQSILTVVKKSYAHTPDLLQKIIITADIQGLSDTVQAECHTCVCWVDAAQFEDLSLTQILSFFDHCHLPQPTKPVFILPHPHFFDIFQGMTSTDVEHVAFAHQLACHIPILYAFPDDADLNKVLSTTFWTTCKSTQTLAACRTEPHRLRYEEASHRAHIPAQSFDAIHNAQKGSQTLISHLENAYGLLDGTWRHLVAIDPRPGTDLMEMAKTLFPIAPVTQKTHLSYLATNATALLNTLANHNFDAQSSRFPSYFAEIFDLYLQLYQNQAVTHQALSHEQQFAIQEWMQKQWVTCSAQTYVLTAKGRQAFPGIQRITDLCKLHAWHQDTDCESPNHQWMGHISTEFLRLPISKRFNFCHQPIQRLFHNILGNAAILRVNADPTPCAWLDAMPICCTYEQTQRIKDLLYQDGYSAHDIELDKSAAQMLTNLQAMFANTPSHGFVEITSDCAQWWTFAGAQNNAITAQILGLMAPKLNISFGNCHIHCRWTPQASSTQAQVEQRWTQLVQNIISWAKAFQTNHAVPSEWIMSAMDFRKQWQKSHLYAWLFEIMPLLQVEMQYFTEMKAWANTFSSQPPSVIAVEQLHHIDPIHPTIFEKLEPKVTDIPQNQVSPSKLHTKKDVKDSIKSDVTLQTSLPLQTSTSPSECLCTFQGTCRIHSENTHSPDIPGLFHTRMPWYYIDNESNLNQALNIMLKQPYIGLDVETTLHDQSLCLIQIGCAHQSFLIDPLAVNISPLGHLFSHPNIIKIIHNASFEKRVLGKLGFQIAPIVDTLSVSRKKYGMKAPGGHSLKSVCQREFHLDMSKECQQSRWEKRPLAPCQLEYAALDAEILIHLYRHFFPNAPR